MCGLCGIVQRHPDAQPSRATLAAMNGCLIHRGPDDDGFFVAPGIGLAMRRLSIIDVAGGAQPQANENETVHIVHNGEIYNHRELRAELEACDHSFHTQSDTEVILHGYEEWDTHVVEKLRGMFAIALWDSQRKRLLLARDRFGKKPLFYAQAKDRLIFASNIRALLAEGSITPRTNLHALDDLFAFGFVPSPQTLFEGIYNLPAAHRLIVADGEIKIERYWDLNFARADEDTINWEVALTRFRELLRDSVAIRRMSEVPLGALLSGGVDSTSIVALLQSMNPEPIQTISIGFTAPGYDESEFARDAASYLHTQHHAFTFSFEDFDRYPDAIKHLEQPQCSATSLPIYLLYEKCKQVGLTVVLTGEGSDELLGGYHWYRGDAQSQALFSFPAFARHLLADSPLPMSSPARRVLRSGSRDVIERYAQWQMVASKQTRENLMATAERNGHSRVNEWREAFADSLAGRPAFSQMQYVESHTRLIDFINVEVDRMSMAHSIEARAPFLDQRLWEFVATLPSHFKLDGAREKHLLREAMKDLLPPTVYARKKQGLAAPHSAWLRRENLPEWVQDALAEENLRAAGYFNARFVRLLWAEHRARRADHSRVLMGVLSTQVWHEIFIARRERKS